MFVPMWLIVALAVVVLGSLLVGPVLWRLKLAALQFGVQESKTDEQRQLAEDYRERERAAARYDEIIRKQRAAGGK